MDRPDPVLATGEIYAVPLNMAGPNQIVWRPLQAGRRIDVWNIPQNLASELAGLLVDDCRSGCKPLIYSHFGLIFVLAVLCWCEMHHNLL